MSSSFQEQLDAFQPPSFEDIELTLPPRRERSANDGTSQRPSGEHGGGADGSPVASETHAGAATPSGSSDPQPQRDDPDEGEHTDSTAEQVTRRAVAANSVDHITADEDQHPHAAADDHASASSAGDEDSSDAGEVSNSQIAESEVPLDVDAALRTHEGRAPRAFTRVAFSAGDVPTVLVKRIPQPIVDALRLMIAPEVGGEFAKAIPIPALLTAFLSAKLHIDLQLDENTRAAADAFRDTEPRLSAIEDRIEEALASIDRLAGAQKYVIKRVADTGKTVDALDLAAAYLVTDRVAGLSTSEVDETNIVVTQKKVLSTRTRIHEQAASQKKVEQDRNERSNA